MPTVSTYATSGERLDTFKPHVNGHGIGRALERVQKRLGLHDGVNLAIMGADTRYGAHEFANCAAPVVVMIVDGDTREYLDWAFAASPAARAERGVRRMYLGA